MLFMFNKAIAIGKPINATEYTVDIYLWRTLAIKRPIDEADNAATLYDTLCDYIYILAVRLYFLFYILNGNFFNSIF